MTIAHVTEEACTPPPEHFKVLGLVGTFYPHVDITLSSSCNPLLDDYTTPLLFPSPKCGKTTDGVNGNQSTVAGKLDAVAYIRADVRAVRFYM